jgi:hypothetical protein
MTQNTPSSPIPWYRQPWPWLLMSMPLAALVGGAITLWLALTSNHALVVDDYYREGKAINLELARDSEATRLGLAATLATGADGSAMLTITAGDVAALPPFVTMRWIHATQAEQDHNMALAAKSPGIYTSADSIPQNGRWNIVLEDPDRRWRLVAKAKGSGNSVAFSSMPAAKNKETR